MLQDCGQIPFGSSRLNPHNLDLGRTYAPLRYVQVKSLTAFPRSLPRLRLVQLRALRVAG